MLIKFPDFRPPKKLKHPGKKLPSLSVPKLPRVNWFSVLPTSLPLSTTPSSILRICLGRRRLAGLLVRPTPSYLTSAMFQPISFIVQAEWRLKPTVTNPLHTLPCWLPKTSLLVAVKSVSLPSTSSSVLLVELALKPLDPVPRVHFVPWLVLVWGLEGLKMLPPFLPIAPGERCVLFFSMHDEEQVLIYLFLPGWSPWSPSLIPSYWSVYHIRRMYVVSAGILLHFVYFHFMSKIPLPPCLVVCIPCLWMYVNAHPFVRRKILGIICRRSTRIRSPFFLERMGSAPWSFTCFCSVWSSGVMALFCAIFQVWLTVHRHWLFLRRAKIVS